MDSGRAVPQEVEQELGELLARASAPDARLVHRSRVDGHARAARRGNRPPVLYVDDLFLSANREVQRFLLAHEVARLVLRRPRLPGARAWVFVGTAFAMLAPGVIAVAVGLLFPTAAWLLWASLIVPVLAAAGVLLFVRREHHTQLFADSYAAEHLGTSIVGVGVALMLMDKPTFTPQRIDPVIDPLFREGFHRLRVRGQITDLPPH